MNPILREELVAILADASPFGLECEADAIAAVQCALMQIHGMADMVRAYVARTQPASPVIACCNVIEKELTQLRAIIREREAGRE